MEKSTASFTGHRKLSNIPAIREARQEIIHLIGTGVTKFLNGAALGFDQLTALLILDLKKEYPQIKLHMVLPCPPEAQTKKMAHRGQGGLLRYFEKSGQGYNALTILL